MSETQAQIANKEIRKTFDENFFFEEKDIDKAREITDEMLKLLDKLTEMAT